MKSDLAVGLLALAFAGIYYYFGSDIPRSLLSDEVGADGLPKMYAAALALLGVSLLWQSSSTVAAAAETGAGSNAGVLAHVRAMGLLLLGVAYLALIGGLGYLFTIFLLIAAVALYSGAAFNLRLLLISAAGGGVFWLVFVKLFDTQLPSGALWQWLTG